MIKRQVSDFLSHIGRLGQHFHDPEHPIRKPRPQHEPLVLRKSIHPIQHPFHIVIPLRQGDRQVTLQHPVLAKKISSASGGLPAPHPPPSALGLRQKRQKAKGKRQKGQRAKAQRAARVRLRASASIPALIIHTAAEGSGTLATRNPRLKSEYVGELPSRNEDRRRLSALSQPPPRNPRLSDDELFIPSAAVSIHSQTFPPCPIVPYALNPPALATPAGTDATASYTAVPAPVPLPTAIGAVLLPVA